MAQQLQDILADCRRGDLRAFGLLVERYQAQALVLAECLTRDRTLAEDVVQEAFLTVFQRLDQLQHPTAFVAWLRQIVRRHALHISKTRQTPTPEENTQQEPVPPSVNIEQQELRRIVRQALKQLPADLQKTAEMFYFDNMKCRDVAEYLDIPEGSVKRRLHDVRNRLRNILISYHQSCRDK
ncbi:MAG: sigma-70 family RNA polymerase sigma factor [Sedimentisphaerales bacterium]|nr:sigma-70 family RNA polymerase sigma factor [Sedimentisphaerales bacterium]